MCMYLVECFPEVVSWSVPGGHCITEEHKVLENTLRVDSNHSTDPTESRVLFIIVSDGAQSLAPHGQELGQEGSHLHWTHQTQSTNGDGRVLQQSLWSVLCPIRAHPDTLTLIRAHLTDLPVDVLNELTQH